MTEKHMKQFYDACSNAVRKHCEKNGIDIKKVTATIISDSTPVMIFTYNEKEIMRGQIVDEPKIKIKKFKP